MKILGRHFETAESVELTISGDRIGKVGTSDVAPDDLPWLAPGFVDLQVNGFAGQEFNDPDLTLDAVAHVSAAVNACGVTSYCPTVTTHSFEVLSSCLDVLGAAHESGQAGRSLFGIHLEGPYISSEDGPRGAHPLEHCRPPTWDEFQRLQGAARRSHSHFDPFARVRRCCSVYSACCRVGRTGRHRSHRGK